MVARVSDEAIASLFPIQFYTTTLDEALPDVQMFHPDARIRQGLSQLQRLNTERVSRRMYHKRNLRIYDNIDDVIYIAKPAEQRLWTIGMALSDAGETVAELVQPAKVLK